MGLAAGQARLLTITGRKSDCEFESMRLSHQKSLWQEKWLTFPMNIKTL